MRAALFFMFLVSALFLPWWFTVGIGIFISTLPYGAVVAIFGGLLMDLSFGAPLLPLFGLEYLYTALFITIAGAMALLEGRVLD